MPRNVNLITGASGTTDIEGSLVLGRMGRATCMSFSSTPSKGGCSRLRARFALDGQVLEATWR
jgi:hypothetical protein